MDEETPTSSKLRRLRRIRIEGYRSFGSGVEFMEFGDFVVLYGLNNAGKSNLLRTIELIGRLVDTPLTRLLDDAEENEATFYKRARQDRMMFALDQASPRVRIEAWFEPDEVYLRFDIEKLPTGIRSQLSAWSSAGRDWLSQARDALTQLRQQTEITPQVHQQLEECKAQWATFGRSFGVAQAFNALPVTDEVRQALARMGRAADLTTRARAAHVRETFNKIVSGLPPGSLEELETSERPQDFGWLSKELGGIVPLDALGSGAQTIFGLLASIALENSPVILIDEPELHLNAVQQESMLEALSAVSQVQIFIATHSVKFARSQLDLRFLERKNGVTRASQRAPPDLREFEIRSAGGPRQEDVSMIAHDGSVELPKHVVQALGATPGQYVYFVKSGEGGFRLVPQQEMDGMLGNK